MVGKIDVPNPSRWTAATVALALLAAPAHAASGRTPSIPGTVLYFETPREGPVPRGPIIVRAGLRGMGVAPSGESVSRTGHHHLLIDTKLGPLDQPLPISNSVVHFSGGETEVEITLSRGWHQLQLVLTDGNHMNFDPPVVSKPISVLVGRR